MSCCVLLPRVVLVSLVVAIGFVITALHSAPPPTPHTLPKQHPANWTDWKADLPTLEDAARLTVADLDRDVADLDAKIRRADTEVRCWRALRFTGDV